MKRDQLSARRCDGRAWGGMFTIIPARDYEQPFGMQRPQRGRRGVDRRMVKPSEIGTWLQVVSE